MKKKALVIGILFMILALATSCGLFGKDKNDDKDEGSSSKTEASETQDSEDAEDKEDDMDLPDDEDGIETPDVVDEDDYIGDTQEVDPTTGTSKGKTLNEMKQAYTGTWKVAGYIYSDGTVENKGGSLTYVFKKDGTYTATGTDPSGKSYDESGKWSINGKKKLVAGDAVMGLNQDGYLLKASGERDGKGFNLNYALAKQ